MAEFNFADIYASHGIAPTAQMVQDRAAPAERIADGATIARILDLVGLYYGAVGLDLSWFREEFAKEDPTFSLVNNERETRVLAAAILSGMIADGWSEAALAVVVGSVAGNRQSVLGDALLAQAEEALQAFSVEERRPQQFDTTVAPTTQAKLGDQITALGQNDWTTLVQILGEIRSEAQRSALTTSNQAATALSALRHQTRLQREELQMLWWLFAGHSRSLDRTFGLFAPAQAALVGALDLASLTSVTRVGPIAAPAMLERVLAMAKKSRGPSRTTLADAVDGLNREDTDRLPFASGDLPWRLAPVSAALSLVKSFGSGSWHTRFEEVAGLPATVEFEPVALAVQLYREHLLGQLL